MQKKEKETDCEEERELKLLRWLFDEDCDGLSDVVHWSVFAAASVTRQTFPIITKILYRNII